MKGILIAALILAVTPSSAQSSAWTVSDANTTAVCVVARMELDIKISYLDDTGARLNTTIDFPENFDRIGGFCEDASSPNTNMLTLEWKKQDTTFSLSVKFTKVSEDGGQTYTKYQLGEVSLHIPMMPELFPNVEAAVANQTLVVRNVDDDGNLMAPAGFSTRLSRCLVCNTEQVFEDLEAHGTDAEHYHDTLVTLTISDVQFIAFKEDETTHISDSGECNKCVMDIAEAPEDRFFVTGSAGEVCIILDMAAKFVIPYKMYDNSTGHGMFNLPTQNETTVSGQCDERRQTVSVTFFEDWVLSASFEKDDITSSGNYNVSDLSLTFTYSDERFVDPHPSIVDTTATVHLSLGNQTTLDPFQAALGQYFKCQKEQTLLLADENGNGARLDTYKFDFQAFKETDDNDFSDAQNFHECSSDNGGGGGSGGAENGDSNAIVHVVIALVVGLAALLLLAVFLIKRQRARSSYQSM